MELRDVIENGIISIGAHVYKRRDHQGSVVNMELVHPAPKETVIHRYPEATAVKLPSQAILQQLCIPEPSATARPAGLQL